ncbi:fimbrial protein [Stenotrophomonas sp. WHRI 8082]|uniref:fimbrial protein n=1 Tax=Stenotrophomonas sp. WHRI 8082 TaxID=3162571 RepID=UPI0032ED810B
MNKLFIALSAALALGASASASAQSGEITFNGEVTSTTCAITWPGAGGTAQDPIVTLPTVPTTSLAAAGATAGKQAVSLVIGTGTGTCTTGTAALELNPNRDAKETNGFLDNTATVDAAPGVQIALRDDSDAAIDIRKPWRSAEIDLSTTQQIDFAAEYRASAATGAGAGKVTSAVNYTVDYK